MWNQHREIREYARTLLDSYGKPIETFYFRKENNRWYWGRMLHGGIKYNEHPFATQKEAQQAASDFGMERYGAAKKCVEEMRKIGESTSANKQ